MDKFKKQQLEDKYQQRLSAIVSRPKGNKYTVYHKGTIIRRGLSLEVCATYGKGYSFIQECV